MSKRFALKRLKLLEDNTLLNISKIYSATHRGGAIIYTVDLILINFFFYSLCNRSTESVAFQRF